MSTKKIKPNEKLLSYDEALARVKNAVTWKLPVDNVPATSALGRVLRENVTSGLNIPPFERSAMDGYAVRATDTKGADPATPISLVSIEDLPAGTSPKHKIGPGQAARIMTGAPLPKGADAVVMVEYTERTASGVKIFRAVSPGENVGHAGEDVKKGALVFPTGARLGPAEMGMLAALGRTRVKVSHRPRVAVLSTGDEITAPGGTLKSGRIYDANGYALAGLARALGCEVKFLGIARDRPQALKQKLKSASTADLVLLTGGVSVGDYDFVTAQLRDLKYSEIFYKAAIKPGKPTFAGKKGKQLVFGLPGNPVSCLVCFHLFVRPALDLITGAATVGMKTGRAVLDVDLRTKPGRRKFLRGHISAWGPELRVTPFPNQKSGVLSSMLHSDILINVPGDTRELPAGTVVDILWL